VAVLPYEQGVEIVGEHKDYAWRVNRGHVVALIVDVPSPMYRNNSSHNIDIGTATGKGNGIGTATGKGNGIGSPATPPVAAPKLPAVCNLPHAASESATMVILDDFRCVGARTCSPDTGNLTGHDDPSFVGILRSFAEKKDTDGYIPTLRVGCAISYSVPFGTHRSGSLPTDMPAAQSGVGVLFGGRSRPYAAAGGYSPAGRGRYEYDNASTSDVLSQPNARPASTLNIDYQ